MIFKSTIISNNSFYSAELASFLAPVVGQMESKWKRCYNALADGWSPRIFHTNCDKKKHTITIIKKESYIFGGYTDIPWESIQYGTWGNTLNAFIFSLKNSEALPPFKCMAKFEDYAIYKHSRYGPSFGDGPSFGIGTTKGESTAQICTPYRAPREVNNNNNVLVGYLGQPAYFSPDNYEVFYHLG